MLIQPATGREPGTHVGTASTTDPDIGDGKLNVKVRFVPARLVTASLVPAQTMMVADVYSPPPSDLIAAGVVAPVEGLTTAFVYKVTRSGMSWHLAADAE